MLDKVSPGNRMEFDAKTGASTPAPLPSGAVRQEEPSLTGPAKPVGIKEPAAEAPASAPKKPVVKAKPAVAPVPAPAEAKPAAPPAAKPKKAKPAEPPAPAKPGNPDIDNQL